MNHSLSFLRSSGQILKPSLCVNPIYILRSRSLSSYARTFSSFLANRVTRSPFCFNHPKVVIERNQLLVRRMSNSPRFVSLEKEIVVEDAVQHVELLVGFEDLYDGVTVNMEQAMDSVEFARKLTSSMSNWRQQGKKGIWIKLPLQLANLVETAVKQGFRYHHAESDHLMLVNWISDSPDTIPANASHRVGVGAFVMNDKREVLVVQERDGAFRGKDVWKLPTGVVNEGEDISAAAIREVKEETGIDTEFLEVLAFRQSHKSFFGKSDMFFLCMLSPCSLDIQMQESEIRAAQWMPVQKYVDQPFNQKNQMFSYMAKICMKKSENEYAGFSPVPSTTSSGKTSYLYCSSDYGSQLLSPGDGQ